MIGGLAVVALLYHRRLGGHRHEIRLLAPSSDSGRRAGLFADWARRHWTPDRGGPRGPGPRSFTTGADTRLEAVREPARRGVRVRHGPGASRLPPPVWRDD